MDSNFFAYKEGIFLPNQELEDQMVKIYLAQQKCLRIQEVFVGVTFPFYLFGIIPVLANFVISLTWGIYLRNKAGSLAAAKYPGLGLRRVGGGFSWDPPIIKKAKSCNDCLTVQILRFNYWSLGLVAASLFVYLFMLTCGSRFIAWQLGLVFS